MTVPNLAMTGKVALITGGRRGIGRALALGFADGGADVAICSRSGEVELQAVANEITKLGRRALAIRADVSSKVDVENMVKKTVAELGYIDILINNAAISIWGSILETEEDEWDKVIDINLKGPYLCSQVVGRLMVERKEGNIINIASIDGLKSNVSESAYSISKAGVIMLTRVLARELGPYNIRVNAVAPGDMKEGMAGSPKGDPEVAKARLPDAVLARFGETDDIVGAALFLASDAASWITGHTLVVDGGYLA